jgi:antitoxin component YwqK of YwqJK toxin-antitoxin module
MSYNIDPDLQYMIDALKSKFERLGLNFDVMNIYLSELKGEDYNLFLKHRAINQQIIFKEKTNDQIATEFLTHILDYIVKDGDDGLIKIHQALKEFITLRKLEGFDLIEKAGPYSLHWLPIFINERYLKKDNKLFSVETTTSGLERFYVDAKGIRHGPYVAFWKNSNTLRLKGAYHHGVKTGLWQSYNRKGVPISFDVLDCCWKEWHKNGNVFVTGYFINGMREGLWRSYYKDGQLKAEGNFIKNKQEGLWRNYYDHRIDAEANFSKGLRHGLQRTYRYPHRLLSEGNYKNGYRHGQWREFDYIAHDVTQINYIDDVKVNDKVSDLDSVIPGNITDFRDPKHIVPLGRIIPGQIPDFRHPYEEVPLEKTEPFWVRIFKSE